MLSTPSMSPPRRVGSRHCKQRASRTHRSCRLTAAAALVSQLVKDGTIGATSQQYPVKMAQNGRRERSRRWSTAMAADKPQNSPGLDFCRRRRGAGHRQAGRRPGEHHVGRWREDLLGREVAHEELIGWLRRLSGWSQPTVRRRRTIASSRKPEYLLRQGSPRDNNSRTAGTTYRGRTIRAAAAVAAAANSARAAFPSLDQPIVGVGHFRASPSRSSTRVSSQPATIGIILQQVSVIAALAIGQTLVILTAGIDLSVGAIAILVVACSWPTSRQRTACRAVLAY